MNSDISETGQTVLSLYHFDYAGSLSVESATSDAIAPWWPWPPETPDSLTTTRQLQIGRAISKSLIGGPNVSFDDVYVVNAALTQNQIQGVTLASKQFGATPAVVMSGDVLEKPIDVLSNVSSVKYISAQTSDLTTFEGQSRSLELLVDEV